MSASYNPITDETGKVVKVVKFAADVSERVYAVRTTGDALSKLAQGDLDFSLDRAFAKTSKGFAKREPEWRYPAAWGYPCRRVAIDEFDRCGRARNQRRGERSSRRTEQQAALEETAAALDEITVNVGNASRR